MFINTRKSFLSCVSVRMNQMWKLKCGTGYFSLSLKLSRTEPRPSFTPKCTHTQNHTHIHQQEPETKPAHLHLVLCVFTEVCNHAAGFYVFHCVNIRSVVSCEYRGRLFDPWTLWPAVSRSQWEISGSTTSPSLVWGLTLTWRGSWSPSSSTSTARCSSPTTTPSSSVNSHTSSLSLSLTCTVHSAGVEAAAWVSPLQD